MKTELELCRKVLADEDFITKNLESDPGLRRKKTSISPPIKGFNGANSSVPKIVEIARNRGIHESRSCFKSLKQWTIKVRNFNFN